MVFEAPGVHPGGEWLGVYPHTYPRGKAEPPQYIALEPSRIKERAGSNPGLFYIPPEDVMF